MIVQFQLSAENIPVLYALDADGCLWMNRSIDRQDSWVKLPLPLELSEPIINPEERMSAKSTHVTAKFPSLKS